MLHLPLVVARILVAAFDAITKYLQYYPAFIPKTHPQILLSSMISTCGRYTHEIAFIGHDVIGNVETLAADTSSCSSFVVSGGGESGVTITTLNEGEALGTGTTVQNVKVGCGAVDNVYSVFRFRDGLERRIGTNTVKLIWMRL